MTGRTREEVLERIKTVRDEHHHYSKRYVEDGGLNDRDRMEEAAARLRELTWVLEALPAPQSRTVYLLNGPFAGQKARIVVPEDPDRLAIRGVTYKLITDPDTGKSLGAYAWVEED